MVELSSTCPLGGKSSHGHMGGDWNLHNSVQHTAFRRLRASCPPLLLPSALGIGQHWCVSASAHMKRQSSTASAKSRFVHSRQILHGRRAARAVCHRVIRPWSLGCVPSRRPQCHTVFLQVVQKTPLPFFAMSLSLSPGAQLMVVGFAGECWWTHSVLGNGKLAHPLFTSVFGLSLCKECGETAPKGGLRSKARFKSPAAASALEQKEGSFHGPQP